MKIFGYLSALICAFSLTAQVASGAVNHVSQLSGRLLNNNFMPQQATSPDLQLTVRVQQQLRTNIKNYNPNDLIINCQNEEVTLEGIVTSAAEVEQIVIVVQHVSGVKQVHNNLMVEYN